MTKPRAKQLGVSDDVYSRMLAAQGGGCAICGNPPKTRRLHVDHDHRTGKVRGLLCMRCNRALPSWITVRWLLGAIRYIVKTRYVETLQAAIGLEILRHDDPQRRECERRIA